MYIIMEWLQKNTAYVYMYGNEMLGEVIYERGSMNKQQFVYSKNTLELNPSCCKLASSSSQVSSIKDSQGKWCKTNFNNVTLKI